MAVVQSTCSCLLGGRAWSWDARVPHRAGKPKNVLIPCLLHYSIKLPVLGVVLLYLPTPNVASLCRDNIQKKEKRKRKETTAARNKQTKNTLKTTTLQRLLHAPDIHESTFSWSNLTDPTCSATTRNTRSSECNRPLRISMLSFAASAVFNCGNHLISECRHSTRVTMILINRDHLIFFSPLPKSLQECHNICTWEMSKKKAILKARQTNCISGIA